MWEASFVLLLRLWVSCEVVLLSQPWLAWSMFPLGLKLFSCRLLLLLLSSQLLLMYFLCTLLIAQLGYLHLARASLTCCISFWKSSGMMQTVLAQWVSVPMMLYLADRLWWLFHCKYLSVWVGLWNTVIARKMSAWGVTKVSRKGMALFPWVPSTVKLIAGSMILIWSRNACLWYCCWMTQVSSTNLNQYLRGWRQTRELFCQMLHVQIGNCGAYQRPHSYSFNLLIEFILKRKVSIMQTEPKKLYDVLYW